MIATYIIPAGNLVAVQAKLQQGADEDGLAGLLGMFTTALSKTGTGNATFYCSSGIMSEAEMDYIENNLPQSLFTFKGPMPPDAEGNPTGDWTPWAAFDSMDLKMMDTSVSF